MVNMGGTHFPLVCATRQIYGIKTCRVKDKHAVLMTINSITSNKLFATSTTDQVDCIVLLLLPKYFDGNIRKINKMLVSFCL